MWRIEAWCAIADTEGHRRRSPSDSVQLSPGFGVTMSQLHRKLAVSMVLVLGGSLVGCLPYSMGATAATVPVGKPVSSISMASVRGASVLRGNRDGLAWPAQDAEFRNGLDDRSDIGVRVTSASGLVMSYKRRVIGTPLNGGVAVQGEGGFVNFGSHALAGVSVVASGNEYADAGLYGGLRMLAVTPITEGAVHDSPTAGGFVGMRLGNGSISVFPEVGVFHDRSALKIRDGAWIVVPSITFRRTMRFGSQRSTKPVFGAPPIAQPTRLPPQWGSPLRPPQ